MPPVRAILLAGLLALASGPTSVSHTGLAQAPTPQVRVPTGHANVHMGGAEQGNPPVDVSMDEIGRDGEWIQVRLRPELRKTGLLMRWYKNEDRGWMHDSTVEVVKPAPR